MEFLGDKCESMFRDNLFPFCPTTPSSFVHSLLSPSNVPFPCHMSYSVGKLKIQSYEGVGGGEKERVPANGQNEGMSLGSFLKC